MKPRDFPIVGIGASAGGLDAYKTLLASLPEDTGASFVLVQHLDPKHESLMADLLARHTRMQVVQAEDDMALSPNTVYVIPPGKFIRIIDQGLFLDEPIKKDGIRLSIDYFFRSLAETRGEKSIAIVLSGTGSDGTLGIRDVKAVGGMVMVQKPDDADYDGMPRSAIASGAVDFVVPVAEMGDRLVRFLRHPYLRKTPSEAAPTEDSADGFQEILRILRTYTQYDFRSYKKGTVHRRIERRMGLRQMKEIQSYIAFLRETPEEVNLLFRDLLIGVTRFFREPAAWKYLEEDIITPLITRKPKGATIRAWVPGCASGEEAYTLAMALFNCIDRLNERVTVQIFATDLNDRAIENARSGHYSSSAAADIPEPMLRKYFIEEDDSIRVNKRLRETVVFATQNVIADPPFSKLDLITCRNLMIYLESDVQQRMIEMFHFALAEGGHLFLGNSENAERPGRLFTTLNKHHRVYRKADVARTGTGSFPIVPSAARTRPKADEAALPTHTSRAELARRRLLERFAPPSVLIDRSMEVQYFHGQVSSYLDHPTGEPTNQLLELALPALRTKVRLVVNTVLGGKPLAEAIARNVPRNGNEVSVKVAAELAAGTEASQGILVYFTDVSEPRDANADHKALEEARANATPEEQSQVASLEYELQSTREDLQSTIEEMETANEELKASNEEVMSMNEELQSTNEELETSREELQSLNEELSTVNSQLEDKIDEVERSNNDLTNLLVSTDIGVIFLDTDLLIRRFTPAMRDIMRIIDNDVGRPVEDIAMRVRDETLLEDARRSLEKLNELEAEITNEAGAHLIRRLRPYRTSENRIEGIVITYTDVSNLQNARTSARRREQQQAAVAELGREALAGAELDTVLELAVDRVASHLNTRFVKILQLNPDKRALTLRTGVGWTHAVVGKSTVHSGVKSQAGYTLERSAPVVVMDFAQERRFSAPSILTKHDIRCGASVIIGPVDDPWGVIGAHESELGRCALNSDDINFLQSVAHILWLVIARDRAVSDIARERMILRDMTDALPVFFAIVDRDARYEFVNRAYEKWGQKTYQIEGKKVRDMVDVAGYAQLEPHIDAVLAGERQNFEIDNVQQTGATSRVSNLVRYVPRVDDAGNVTGFYSAVLDITEKKQLERDLAERFMQYQVLGESIPFGVWITDAQGQLTYVSQSFLDLVGMSFEELKDRGWLKCLVPHTVQETADMWQATIATGTNWEKEHRINGADGALHHVLAIGRPIRNDAGEVTSWVGLNLDITERKSEEERLEVISAELEHRVKNILATVATIAWMTGKNKTTVEAYRTALQGRFEAMAAAHKLLADANWRGMSVRDMVETELRPHLGENENRIEITGDDTVLTAEKVQTFALALHELTTNSLKYGALKTPEGHLAVRWRSQDGFEMEWIESGLSGIAPPTAEGFGTTLLTRILSAQNVSVALDYRDNGLHAHLVDKTPTPMPRKEGE